MVTVGALVSTSKVYGGVLCPTGFPSSELGSLAIAVYLPFSSSFVMWAGPQCSPDTGAVSVATGLPFRFFALEHFDGHRQRFARRARERRRRVVRNQRRLFRERHDRRYRVDFEADFRRAFAFSVAEPALLGRHRRERVFPGRQRFAQAARRPFPARRPSFSRSPLLPLPRNTCTTTSVFSLALPENDGFGLFDGVAARELHHGRFGVDFERPRCRSSPSPFPSPLFSVAFAVNVCLPDDSTLLNAARRPVSRPTPSFSRSRLRSRLRTRAPPLRCFRSRSPENDGFVLFDGMVG